MRRIIILGLLLISLTAHAEDKYVYSVISFEKGLNSQISPLLLEDNQCQEAINIRFNKQYGALAKRKTMQLYGDASTAAITSIYRFYASDATKHLLATTSTFLKLGSDSAGTFSTLKSGLSDGVRWTWATYMDNAIGMNGTDLPIKYDGCTSITANTDAHRTAGNLVAELGAPYAELDDGSDGDDLDAESWYMYKMAWYDGTTYTYTTARSNPILTGTAATGTQNINLTNIPLGPTGTTHRYIYRTLGGADKATVLADTTYYLIKDLDDNTTTTYADAMTDDDADADNAPTWATSSAGYDSTAPIGDYCLIHKERLFIAGNSTNHSDLYWSDVYNPDYFTVTDLEQIRPDDGDSITFLREQLGILTIGKENTIQKFYTTADSSASWYTSNPISFVGCPAPYSVANTPLGILYLGRKGIYNFTGQQSNLISDAVTPEIVDIKDTELDNVVGFYWNNEYHLSYTSDESGASINNRVLVYDIVRDAYSLDYKDIGCFCAFNSGTDYGILYSGSSDTDGYVYAHEGSPLQLIKRYKSEFDNGTYDDTMSFGAENDPVITLEALDKMEDYTTDTLAQAAWVTSETTEKIPPDLGDGTDGAKTVDEDETLGEGTYNYTSLTVDAACTLTISGSTTIKVQGDVTVNGDILGGEALNIYAVNITTAAGTYILNPAIHLRANTITNGGTIDDNFLVGSTVTYVDQAKGNSEYNNQCATAADMHDDDYDSSATYTHSSIAAKSAGTVVAAFRGKMDISQVTWKWTCAPSASGAPSGTQFISLYYNGSWHDIFNDTDASSTITTTAVSGSWANVEKIQATVYAASPNLDGATATTTFYDLTNEHTAPVYDYINGSGVDTADDVTDFENALECYAEDSTVSEGSQSLKVVCANGSITEDAYLSKTITAIDLSASTHDTILIDVKASRAGTNFQLGIDEAAGDFSGTGKLQDVTVAAANTWETIELDYSGVTDASKDAIVLLRAVFTDTDAYNTVYIDDIRPALASGNWVSPVYTVEASLFNKIYWNESLGDYGDITVQMKASDDSGSMGTYSSAYTAPAGSDISAIAGKDYVQFKVNFTTTEEVYPPKLYMEDNFLLRMVYTKAGSTGEGDFLSRWVGGLEDFKIPGYKKQLKRLKIYYTGNEGSLIIGYDNEEGDISTEFSIDMSQAPPYTETSGNKYTGIDSQKIYTYYPTVNAEGLAPIGQLWKFSITENGSDIDWTVDRVEGLFSVENIYN